MKAKVKIRKLRALAIAASLSALVVPGAAIAMPEPYFPTHQVTVAQQQQAYTLPASFHTEVQTSSRPTQSRPFTLPASFRPEVQTPTSPSVPSTHSTPVVREIRTVTDGGSHTLAIVLAAIALAVALCGSAYAAVSLTRMQRNPRSPRASVS
jgi:hypothetical protein